MSKGKREGHFVASMDRRGTSVSTDQGTPRDHRLNCSHVSRTQSRGTQHTIRSRRSAQLLRSRFGTPGPPRLLCFLVSAVILSALLRLIYLCTYKWRGRRILPGFQQRASGWNVIRRLAHSNPDAEERIPLQNLCQRLCVGSRAAATEVQSVGSAGGERLSFRRGEGSSVQDTVQSPSGTAAYPDMAQPDDDSGAQPHIASHRETGQGVSSAIEMGGSGTSSRRPCREPPPSYQQALEEAYREFHTGSRDAEGVNGAHENMNSAPPSYNQALFDHSTWNVFTQYFTMTRRRPTFIGRDDPGYHTVYAPENVVVWNRQHNDQDINHSIVLDFSQVQQPYMRAQQRSVIQRWFRCDISVSGKLWILLLVVTLVCMLCGVVWSMVAAMSGQLDVAGNVTANSSFSATTHKVVSTTIFGNMEGALDGTRNVSSSPAKNEVSLITVSKSTDFLDTRTTNQGTLSPDATFFNTTG